MRPRPAGGVRSTPADFRACVALTIIEFRSLLAHAVENEESRGIVHADAAGGDAAILQDLRDALEGALIFLPHADLGAGVNQLPRAHFFEAGKDPRGLAFGGNHDDEGALAFAPADAGEIGHRGSGLEHDRAEAELLHRLLRLDDARLKFFWCLHCLLIRTADRWTDSAW